MFGVITSPGHHWELLDGIVVVRVPVVEAVVPHWLWQNVPVVDAVLDLLRFVQDRASRVGGWWVQAWAA